MKKYTEQEIKELVKKPFFSLNPEELEVADEYFDKYFEEQYVKLLETYPQLDMDDASDIAEGTITLEEALARKNVEAKLHSGKKRN